MFSQATSMLSKIIWIWNRGPRHPHPFRCRIPWLRRTKMTMKRIRPLKNIAPIINTRTMNERKSTSKETHHFFFYFDDNMTHLNRFSFGKILDKKKRNVSCGGGVGCFTTVFFDIPFSSDDVISPLIAVANWAPS